MFLWHLHTLPVRFPDIFRLLSPPTIYCNLTLTRHIKSMTVSTTVPSPNLCFVSTNSDNAWHVPTGCFNGIPVVGCEVTLKVGGLVGKPDQGAPGVQDLLHPNAAGPEAVHALPDHGENALGDGPLRVGPLHLVFQHQACLWLITENKNT